MVSRKRVSRKSYNLKAMEMSEKNLLTICPFEWRYGSSEMRRIFSVEYIVGKYVEVEKAIIKGLAEAGFAPKKCTMVLDKCSSRLKAFEVYEMEKKTGHDISSLAYLLGEYCGECGKYVHLGATSNDIVDTAWALIVREALSIMRERLKKLVNKLASLAREYSETIMVGRTHGQHALPITFGFKLANYVYELARSYERICDAEKRFVKGKISGAVGTMAAWGSKGFIVEEAALNQLHLEPHAISTQIAPRDSLAELVLSLLILASQLDRLAVEIRELSRPELREVAEGVGERVGSSTMPHKRNPVSSERVSGLARFLRSFATTVLENIVLWHERDLSNSSFERITLPHVFLAIDQALIDMYSVVEKLVIYPENMMRNLKQSKGTVLSEAVMVKLVEKGVPRHEAHQLLIKLSREALDSNKEFKKILLEDPFVSSVLNSEEIESLLRYENYLGASQQLIDRALEYWEKTREHCMEAINK